MKCNPDMHQDQNTANKQNTPLKNNNYFDTSLDSVWIDDHWEMIAAGDSVVIQSLLSG